MFLYTLRNPDKVCGLVGIATAADHTQRVWKGLDKEKKVEVQRSGVYDMPNEYGTDPIPLSMELFSDGEKYSILDMPGTYYICTYICTYIYVHTYICRMYNTYITYVVLSLPCTLSLFKTARLDITHKMYSSEVHTCVCIHTSRIIFNAIYSIRIENSTACKHLLLAVCTVSSVCKCPSVCVHVCIIYMKFSCV